MEGQRTFTFSEIILLLLMFLAPPLLLAVTVPQQGLFAWVSGAAWILAVVGFVVVIVRRAVAR